MACPRSTSTSGPPLGSTTIGSPPARRKASTVSSSTRSLPYSSHD
jgi:hypothetical protein